MIGHADQLGNRTMPSWRDDSCVDRILIGVEDCLFLIHGGDFVPERFTTQATTVADMKGDNLARSGVHGNPDPLPVRLGADKAPELVQLGLQLLQDHLWSPLR